MSAVAAAVDPASGAAVRRVLVVAPPFYGLLYPVVPLAQALRTAGHEVLVATAGPAAQWVADAGLPALDAAPGLDPDAEYLRVERELAGATPEQRRRSTFSFFADEMADRVVAVADAWRPDLVVQAPLGAAGQLVAARHGVPLVVQGVGFGHRIEHVELMAERIAGAYERHGVDAPAAVDAWLDVVPPSMRTVEDGVPRRATRFVPYNGGAVLPPSLLAPAPHGRIAVTLGTIVPLVEGLRPLEWLLEAAPDADAELLLVLGDVDRSALPPLPDNVRALPWTPLHQVLAVSDAIVHHGGAGTTLTALAAGVPQLVVGRGADRAVNASGVADRGCGFVPDGQPGADALRRVRDDAALAAAAAEVRAEISTLPSPAAVAGRLARDPRALTRVPRPAPPSGARPIPHERSDP